MLSTSMYKVVRLTKSKSLIINNASVQCFKEIKHAHI